MPPSRLKSDAKPSDRLLTAIEMRDIYGVKSAATVLRWEKLGKIPKARKIGRSPRWLESEVLKHLKGLERFGG